MISQAVCVTAVDGLKTRYYKGNDKMSDIQKKLLQYFDEMVVYKDFRQNGMRNFGIPSFLRDWLMKKYQDSDGVFDIGDMQSFIKKRIPSKEDWNAIKSRLLDGELVKILAKTEIDIDVQTGEYRFELPDYGLRSKETIIDEKCIEKNREDLTRYRTFWGQMSLGYRAPTDPRKRDGRIVMRDFKNFCPYTLDLDYYKDMSAEFTTEEWIDVLLGAVDYNASGYVNQIEKLTVLSRLLIYVQNNLNMIELAPKGTGKSTFFESTSKYGRVIIANMSRASMFYNKARRKPGLIFDYDFVAVDEVQSAGFTDIDEMRTSLKGYLESGKYSDDSYEGISTAGMVLMGNILCDDMDVSSPMFQQYLPKAFHESALLDRFHGFIKGWDIPRLHEGIKMNGWALNTEYFSSILHMLRSDASYDAIVEELIVVPERADTRDTTAVKRLASAWLKLLFPKVRRPEDVDLREFRYKCFEPACRMRGIICQQLKMMDSEYDRPFADYDVRRI